jgi:hypothetical protein
LSELPQFVLTTVVGMDYSHLGLVVHYRIPTLDCLVLRAMPFVLYPINIL